MYTAQNEKKLTVHVALLGRIFTRYWVYS